jgi:hypothetical protein
MQGQCDEGPPNRPARPARAPRSAKPDSPHSWPPRPRAGPPGAAARARPARRRAAAGSCITTARARAFEDHLHATPSDITRVLKCPLHVLRKGAPPAGPGRERRPCPLAYGAALETAPRSKVPRPRQASARGSHGCVAALAGDARPAALSSCVPCAAAACSSRGGGRGRAARAARGGAGPRGAQPPLSTHALLQPRAPQL